jgi:hypothetical protein
MPIWGDSPCTIDSRALAHVLALVCFTVAGYASAADRYDAAVTHGGRSADDLKRDPIDHPVEVLRLAGIKPGMRVADVLAGDGYYSDRCSRRRFQSADPCLASTGCLARRRG